eukprot:gene18442-biopygen6914
MGTPPQRSVSNPPPVFNFSWRGACPPVSVGETAADASHTMEFEETDASRTRPRPFLLVHHVASSRPSGRGPDAGRTIGFKEMDSGRARTGRGQCRFSLCAPSPGDDAGRCMEDPRKADPDAARIQGCRPGDDPGKNPRRCQLCSHRRRWSSRAWPGVTGQSPRHARATPTSETSDPFGAANWPPQPALPPPLPLPQPRPLPRCDSIIIMIPQVA